MNDDPGPSSAARHRQLQVPPRSDDGAVNDNVNNNTEVEGHGDDRPAEQTATQRQEKRRQGLAKKLELVNHLQKSLDMMVFTYACVLYYMECSFFRFILRLAPHYTFLTPQDTPPNDGLLLPTDQLPIHTIFLPGLFCLLIHLFFRLPEAGEATRGYLHGGVIIDFIGQKPPTSRLAFLALDLVILGTQCLMLAVHQERESLKKAVLPPGSVSVSATGLTGSNDQGAAASVTGTTTQDHDAEERGVLRDETYLGDVGNTVESQTPLSRSNNALDEEDLDHDHSHDEQGGNTYSSATANAGMLDVLRSGNAVLANLHVVHAVRTTGQGSQGTAAYWLRSMGYGVTLVALAAGRRSRLIARPSGR
ncbi:uncharacterized protein C8A04DRAFT_13453 [Dichotomopilus funicola]|uniref:DUF1746 domain-containing protein n=1 Tax=Dichotomopilus funicola TaxID=1934379 RepID=A0AAN6UZP3_9PEZI|nr:hypothetical protein C8A04DRAFT_13453 [Dichotomopilus funicola]